MAFSVLGALGGASEKITAGWAKDRLAQAQRQAAMLQIIVPRAMDQRKADKIKMNKFSELARKLKNYLPESPDLIYGLLESGEEYTKNWIKTVEDFRRTIPMGEEGKPTKRITDIEVLKAAGAVPESYVLPSNRETVQTFPTFNEWWNSSMLGKPGQSAISKDEELGGSLHLAMRKQFGRLTPDDIQRGAYKTATALLGGTEAELRSTVSGDRIRTPSKFTDAIRMPITNLERLAHANQVAEGEINSKLFKLETTVEVENEDGTKTKKLVPLAVANAHLGIAEKAARIEEMIAHAAYWRANGTGTSAKKGFKSYNDKFFQFSRLTKSNLLETVGVEYFVDPTTKNILPSLEGSEEKRNLYTIAGMASQMMGQSWGDEGAELFSKNINPFERIAALTTKYNKLPMQHAYLASAAGRLDGYSKATRPGEKELLYKEQIFNMVPKSDYLLGIYQEGYKIGLEKYRAKGDKGAIETPKTGKVDTEKLAAFLNAIDPEDKGTILTARKDLVSNITSIIASNTTFKGMEVDDLLEDVAIGEQIGLPKGTSIAMALNKNPKTLIGAIEKLSAADFEIGGKKITEKAEIKTEKVKPPLLAGDLIAQVQATQAAKDTREKAARQAAENRRLEQERLLAEQRGSILKRDDTKLSIQDRLEETTEWVDQFVENPDLMTEENITIVTENVISFLELAKKNNLLAFSKKYMDMSGKEMLEDEAIGEYLIGYGLTLKEAINSPEDIMYLSQVLQEIVGRAYAVGGYHFTGPSLSPVKATMALGARPQ